MLDRSADPTRRIVVMTAGGPLSRIIVNGLCKRLGPVTVIEESAESKGEIIHRRARLLGWAMALSQAAAGLVIRLLNARRSGRIERIIRDHGLDTAPHGKRDVRHVTTVNAPETLGLLRELQPDVVAVYGTRILKPATLAAISAPFINYHAGINPKYRGQHPGYWALASGDPDNAGVTIHLVDAGVDTGGVLYQARCRFDAEDTISSYQYLQAAHALPLFARALEDALRGQLVPRRVDLPSKQWFPPTLGSYITTGLLRGVW